MSSIQWVGQSQETEEDTGVGGGDVHGRGKGSKAEP